MSSGEAPIARGEQEAEEEREKEGHAITLPRISSAYPTPTMATTTTTTTTSTSTASVGEPTRQSYFSPKKRKRDEITETPWRVQHGVAPQQRQGEKGDEQDEEKVEVEVEVEDEAEDPVLSGQVSPNSNKLASQLSDLNLSGKLAVAGEDLEMTMAATAVAMEEEEPVAKKVKRKGGAAIPNGRKVTVTMVDASTGDESGSGSGSEGDIVLDTKRKQKGIEKNGNGKIHNGSTSRPRLRSPPLSKTRDSDASDNDGATVADDSDDIDSDDPEQLGVGYRPTPTQRYVRSQKRMQQVYIYSGAPFL